MDKGVAYIRMPLAFAALLGACGANDAPAAKSRSPLADFLIQNVCVDEAGATTGEDPASCLRSRDLQSGEVPPFLLTDYDKAYGGTRYQAVTSVPTPEGRVRVSKHMGDDLAAEFDPASDGYDIIEQDGNYVSFIATYDQQCGEQRLSGAGSDDGWLLFPNRPLGEAGSRRQDMTVERIDARAACPSGERMSRVGGKQIVAYWEAPHTVSFESGKTLTTIVSEHHAHHDLSQSNNAIERFYFTREYGLSRWEAWIPKSRCIEERGQGDPLRMCDPDDPENFLRGRCAPDDGTAMRGGQQWIRIDCRDTTFHWPRP
ncbi:hypothetical protein [Novosphingobium aquimarinum]|uniref:hypothetical protein n=1 Tax=Novosphingobium aquimarinum TaxID=2682494 RepID=UPI0018DC5BA9|nr:hypothetical protein [Novosphingobium aquimarinum]